MRHAAGGHTWTPPRLQRLSFVVGQSGEDCRHTSGLLARCASALMECAGWLLYKSCELEARCARQVRPAPVLPVLPLNDRLPKQPGGRVFSLSCQQLSGMRSYAACGVYPGSYEIGRASCRERT